MNCEPIHRGAHQSQEGKASRGLVTQTHTHIRAPRASVSLSLSFSPFFFLFRYCSSTLRCLIFILHSATSRWKWIFQPFWKFERHGSSMLPTYTITTNVFDHHDSNFFLLSFFPFRSLLSWLLFFDMTLLDTKREKVLSVSFAMQKFAPSENPVISRFDEWFFFFFFL